MRVCELLCEHLAKINGTLQFKFLSKLGKLCGLLALLVIKHIANMRRKSKEYVYKKRTSYLTCSRWLHSTRFCRQPQETRAKCNFSNYLHDKMHTKIDEAHRSGHLAVLIVFSVLRVLKSGLLFSCARNILTLVCVQHGIVRTNVYSLNWSTIVPIKYFLLLPFGWISNRWRKIKFSRVSTLITCLHSLTLHPFTSKLGKISQILRHKL